MDWLNDYRSRAAVIILILLIPATATAQLKTRFNWTSPASNLSGSWVAYEEGFFKKHGLDLELLHIPLEHFLTEGVDPCQT